MTEEQHRMLCIVRDDYVGIADTGNIGAETGWDRVKIENIGGELVVLGLLLFMEVDDTGFDGGVWKTRDTL